MREDLRLSLFLGLACGLATAALFPYLMITMPQALAKLPAPLPAVVLLQSLQSFVLLTLLSFCGLRMGHRLGLGAPWLRALLFRRERIAQPWLPAIAWGVLAGIAIIALDPLFAPFMPKPLHALPPAAPQAHAFAGFLASFYGGIAEECMMRLFLVTLFAWILCRASRGATLRWHLVAAVVLAALLFGAGHLPAAAKLWPLDGVVVARTLVLNGLAGVVFGWFYVRHGLESAILGHFCADLVLHVAAPLAMAGA
jgi:membrane protease YdiL (CAAX protease family)